MGALVPRVALGARLHALPAPDDDEFQPTHFFRRLLDAQTRVPQISAEALWSDHQRLQGRLSDALAAFHHHRACAGIEFAVVLATHGAPAARPYMADVARWIGELHRLITAEVSAVERFVR